MPYLNALRSRSWFVLGLALLTVSSVRADDWPQWLGPQRDGVWREKGILDKFPTGGPVVRWRTPIGGGYAGPAVADGRVYVADRILASGAKDPDNLFARTDSAGKERILCLAEDTGKVLWRHEYDVKYAISYPCGPRHPLVSKGRVHVLGAMGDLLCLDAATGKLLWTKNFPKDYEAPVPVWGFAAHPLLDGDKLICLVGGQGSVVVAFDAATGEEKWKSLSFENPATELGYCPPMIYKINGVRQLIVWHPEAVNGLDPETGKPYWSQKFKLKANMAIATPRLAGDKLLVSSFYNGSMMLKLTGTTSPEAEVVWKGEGRGEVPERTDGLHSVMATPFIRDGYVYGVCSYGEMRCVQAADGKRVWEDLRDGNARNPTERWANAFLVQHGDRCFLFNEKGDLIIARLSPKGYEEIDRAHVIDPTGGAMKRKIVWSHPAFANRSMFVRNDKEIVCVSLAAPANRQR